jgi:hypothetical protein
MLPAVTAPPPNLRVFVVQLSSGAELGHGRLVGRLEHVASGRSARFASDAEMSGFFARVLREGEEPGTGDDTDNCVREHPRRF